MKKNVIKLITLLLSTSLAVACNTGSSTEQPASSTDGSSENSAISSADSEQSLSTIGSSDVSASSAKDSSSSFAYGSSNSQQASSSYYSSSQQGSSASSTSSTTIVPVEDTLDTIIAKFVDGLGVDVPELDDYELEFEVLYSYAYESYGIYCYRETEGADIVNDLTVAFDFSNLVCMNDDQIYPVESYGYMYGDDEYGSNLTVDFWDTEDNGFVIQIVRVDGYGLIDVSDVDTSWYVDYINFGDFDLATSFPATEANTELGINATIPSLGDGKYPYVYSPAYIDEEGYQHPDSFYAVIEGDQVQAAADLLRAAGFTITITEHEDYEIDWETFSYVEVAYLEANGYDASHTISVTLTPDDYNNTLVILNRFEDVYSDALTTNTAWTEEETALMVSTLGEVLPFMKFGDDYYLFDDSDEQWDVLVLFDSYIYDLSLDYIELLLANGFKKDSYQGDPYYVKDNGFSRIEIFAYYSNGNVLEIYFSDSTYAKLESIDLNVTELDIVKGAEYQLVATINPSDAYNKITWTSSNEDIATVDQNGLVKISDDAADDSTVTITATGLGGISNSCIFTVKAGGVTGVAFTETEYKVAPGKSVQTEFDVLPYGAFYLATEEYSVEPADAGVSVDENGLVTVSSEATVGTEVTLTLTFNGSLTATAKVIVASEAIKHTLTQSTFGLTNGNSDYKTHKVTLDDGASYEAQCASTNGIQIRSKNKNSGIIGHFDGKSCQSITVNFDSHTASGKVIEIYASNSAFSIADMYCNKVTKVGELSYKDGQNSYTFEGSYSYIGIRSADGAIYMDSVDIIWG